MHQHRKTPIFVRRRYGRNLPIRPHNTFNQKAFARFRDLSYGFPVMCIVAFLGIFAYSLNVGTIFNYAEKTYAEGESTSSGTVTPQATISIKPSEGQYGAGVDSTTVVGSMGMAYRSHDVTVHAQDVTKYSLNISYADGKDALRLEGGSTYFANVASTGQTPSTMKDNTWGFAWGETTEAEDEMTYYVMPQYGSIGTDLAGGMLENENTYNQDFTKKLVFGAKFGSQNEPGHYKTAVILSLAANAQEVVTTLDDLRYMQDITPAICASTKAGENATLQDKRDGSEYVVQKLEDGNCWMLQNLKLTKEGIESWQAQYPDTENNVKLSSKYSNVASGSTFEMPETIATLTSGSTTQFAPNSNYNSTAQIYSGSVQDANWQEGYGAYYNWYAATAGSGNASVTADKQDVNSSICPKGWRLPAGNITDTSDVRYPYSYNKLVADAGFTNNSAGSAALRGEPYNFYSAGQISDGSFRYVGTSGYYWTSVSGYNNKFAYNFYFTNNSVSLTKYDDRFRGLSVRCVAATSDLELITTMQEMTPKVCKNTQTGFSKALMDIRDGSKYYVQKLSDGNCWMLQNLKLTKEGIESWQAQYPDTENNVQLSSKYSNVAEGSTFSMPTTISSLSSGSSSQFGSSSNYNTTAQIYNGGSKDVKWQEGYGAYYNWYAATAGTGNASVTTQGQDVNSSICPKGWRLPTSYKTDTSVPEYKYSFNQLVIDPLTGNPYAISNDANYIANAWKAANYTNTTLGLTNASGAVLSNGFFPAAGYVLSGYFRSVGSNGCYWSSTAYDSSYAYSLYFDSSDVNPPLNGNRYSGRSVRCVAPAS